MPDLIADFLLTQPIDANAKEMPSPTALKHKIILKVLLHPRVSRKFIIEGEEFKKVAVG